MKTTKEKDMVKAGRLNEAYRYLFSQQSVTSQTDFAEKIGVRDTSLSFAMNGNPAYLTKNLFIKICAAFPNIFNRDYLLTGEGTLLAPKEEDIIRNVRRDAEPAVGAIIELYAQLIKEVEAYRAELKEEISTTRQLNQELRTTLRELRDDSDRHYSMAAEG